MQIGPAPAQPGHKTEITSTRAHQPGSMSAGEGKENGVLSRPLNRIESMPFILCIGRRRNTTPLPEASIRSGRSHSRPCVRRIIEVLKFWDERLNALRAWLQSTLRRDEVSLAPASSDASFRRYFRIDAPPRSLIAMDAPPEHENIDAFLAVGRRFLALGLNVPAVLAVDRSRGFLLVTDLGSATYLEHLQPHTADRLYDDALNALAVLQRGTFDEGPPFPDYDRAALMAEMELFRQWYIPAFRRGCARRERAPAHRPRVRDPCREALSQPQVLVHRDYHSRNLMVCADNNPGILDFQDAVTGPITYDSCPCSRTATSPGPWTGSETGALGYRDRAQECGLLSGVDDERFLRWVHRVGVQRHIKVLGIFARLYLRDGKPAYLDDLPLVHRYLLDATARDAELGACTTSWLPCRHPLMPMDALIWPPGAASACDRSPTRLPNHCSKSPVSR